MGEYAGGEQMLRNSDVVLEGQWIASHIGSGRQDFPDGIGKSKRDGQTVREQTGVVVQLR